MSMNSFPDNKPIENEYQEEKNQSKENPKNDNSVSFCQINESLFVQGDEDSSKNIWQDSEYSLNDFPEESPFGIPLNDKTPISSIQLNLSIDENISIDKSSSFNQSKDIYCLNESEFDGINLNMPKFNENEEKISGDSFLSSLELSPNQDYIYFRNSEFNIEEGVKNYSKDIDIKGPTDEIKGKINSNKNNPIEDKKKSKINFFVSNVEINCENNLLEKRNNSENEYLSKKRENNNKSQQIEIKKNCLKNTNLNEINKVTIIHPKAYKCECGKIFSTEENQRLHYINIHLHEKPYNCSFCGEGFSHRNGKIYHERVYHTFIFPYPCKICNSAFASKSAMIYHMKSKHKIN